MCLALFTRDTPSTTNTERDTHPVSFAFRDTAPQAIGELESELLALPGLLSCATHEHAARLASDTRSLKVIGRIHGNVRMGLVSYVQVKAGRGTRTGETCDGALHWRRWCEPSPTILVGAFLLWGRMPCEGDENLRGDG